MPVVRIKAALRFAIASTYRVHRGSNLALASVVSRVQGPSSAGAVECRGRGFPCRHPL